MSFDSQSCLTLRAYIKTINFTAPCGFLKYTIRTYKRNKTNLPLETHIWLILCVSKIKSIRKCNDYYVTEVVKIQSLILTDI